jgi:N-acetylglutamate synthase-like GNAT family acetyltransferase
MLTTRMLPPDEWAKLAPTALESVWQILRAGIDHVIVVEDDGVIVGCWTLIPVVHCEGIWIHRDHRHRGNVARRLIHAMQDEAQAMGAQAVVTSALVPEVADLATRLGAEILPGTHFVLPVVTVPRTKETV